MSFTLTFFSNFLSLDISISSVQLFSHVRLFLMQWTRALQASLSITNCWSYSNSSPLNQWCHPTISSSVAPFSSCAPSFEASGSFPMSQFFTSGGQSIGVSASMSVFPISIRDWFPRESHGWRSLVFCSPRGRKELDATYWLNNNKQEKYPSKFKKKTFIAFNRSYML